MSADGQTQLLDTRPTAFQDASCMLGAHSWTRQLEDIAPLVRHRDVRPKSPSGVLHTVVAQQVLGLRDVRGRMLRPYGAGLYKSVWRRAGADLHHTNRRNVPVTGCHSSQAVPVFYVVVRPRMPRQLIRQRKVVPSVPPMHPSSPKRDSAHADKSEQRAAFGNRIVSGAKRFSPRITRLVAFTKVPTDATKWSATATTPARFLHAPERYI